MSWNEGFEQDNGAGNTVYAEHINHIVMASRSNYVLDVSSTDCKVTAQSTPDQTVQVAAGDVFVAGVKRTVSADSSFDLSSYIPGTSGESVFVFVYVNSSGSLAVAQGSDAATGTQLPNNYPKDAVVLAMIVLTNGDTISSADIEDWRMEAPQGAYLNGAVETPSTLTTGGSLSVTGNVSATGSLTGASTNFITKGTTGTIAAANAVQTDSLSPSDTSAWSSESGVTTLLSVAAHQLGVVKDDMTITIDLVSNGFTQSSLPVPSPTIQFRLVISNNDTNFGVVDTASYNAPANQGATNAVATLDWDISADGLYVSDDFGDDIRFKVQAYVSDADSADGGTISFNYDISDGAATALWDQVLTSTTSDATILSRS